MEALLMSPHVTVQFLAYVFLFLGMFIEGEAVFFVAIYLVNQDLMSFWSVIAISFIGMFLGDIAWYKFGIHLESLPVIRWIFRRKIVQKTVEHIDGYLIAKPFAVIVFAKFAYGFHRLILLRAGNTARKLPFKKFLKFDFCAVAIWIIFVSGIGSLSSVAFFFFKKYLKFGELGLVLGFALLILLSRLITKLGERKIENN